MKTDLKQLQFKNKGKIMNELENNQQYISQKGFIKIDVIRGFSEIAFLYRIIKETVKNNGFICGGYVRYMCSPLVNPIPAGDVDIYSKTQDDFDKLKMDKKKLLVEWH